MAGRRVKSPLSADRDPTMSSSLSIAVAFGLSSAGFWGVSDLFARISSRQIGPFRTLFLGQFVGLVLLSAYLLATHAFRAHAGAPLSAWGYACAAAVLFNVATLLLYHAFEVGVLAIVSPLSACYAVVSAGLSLLCGERLSTEALAGIAVVLTGIPLAASMHEVDAPGAAVDESVPHTPRSSGVSWAMMSAVAYGISFWMYGDLVTPQLGGLEAAWVSYALSSALLALGFLRRAERQTTRRAGPLLVAASGGAMAAVGTSLDLCGLATGHIALVTTLSSLFSTLTVLLAWAVLREPMTRKQWAGVALICAGVVLLRG